MGNVLRLHWFHGTPPFRGEERFDVCLFQPVLWRLGRLPLTYFALGLQPKVHLRTFCLAALLPKLVSALSNLFL
jgi:hypothetical protein